MANKEHDLFMDMLANPDMTIAEYAAMDFNADNTQLLDASVYKNSEKIKNDTLFLKEDGSFDNDKFETAYANALYNFNILSTDTYVKKIKDQFTTFSSHDIFAPKDANIASNEPILYKRPNMFKLSFGLTGVNLLGPQKWTEDEIAQQKKVLQNPSEAYNADGTINYDKAKWAEAPEGLFSSGFWTDFREVRVLALYDDDGEHLDLNTGELVPHKKGELRLDEQGTPYYENLDGRTPYGRRVLNRLNLITKEASPWNEYDFFDADDLEQKSMVGVTARNLALIGSMFLPTVGPILAGLSAGVQITGMLATLAKMVTLDSDNETLSQIEGWALSWNRQYGKTLYALEHTWCFENFVDVFADLIALLREQRVLFLYVPAIVKGKVLSSDTAVKKLEKSLLEKYKNEALDESGVLFKDMFKRGVRSGLSEEAATVTAKMSAPQIAGFQVNRALNSFMSDYNDIGAFIGKAYMAGLISNGLYGEAKVNGLSDVEATAVTMGRFLAEMALLNTPIGEYMFPELRYEGARMGRIVNEGFYKEVLAQRNKLNPTATLTEKATWFNNLIKKVFHKSLEAQTEAITLGEHKLKTAFSMGFEAGLVNDIEEGLNDLAKAAYNTSEWLRSDDNRGFLDASIGEKAKWKVFENSFDRYAMGMASGLVGGGITSYVQNVLPLRQLAQINSLGKAIQQLIYMVRNGEHYKLLDWLDKHTFGDTHLSDQFEIVNGEAVAKPAGDGVMSQDQAFKYLVREQIKLIELLINEEGVSDKEFLDLALRKDLRAQMLAMDGVEGLSASPVADRYITYYNKLLGELAEAKGKTIELQNVTTDGKQVTDGNKKEAKEAGAIAETQVSDQAKAKMKEVKTQLDSLLSGKMGGLFLTEGLFSMSLGINNNICGNITSKNGFAFAQLGLDYDSLSDTKKAEIDKQWDAWQKSPMKTEIVMEISHKAHELFGSVAKVLEDNQLLYDLAANNTDIQKLTTLLSDSYDFMAKFGAMEENAESLPETIQSSTAATFIEAFAPELLTNEDYIQALENVKQALQTLKSDPQNKEAKQAFIDALTKTESYIRDAFSKSVQALLTNVAAMPFLNSEIKSVLLNQINDYATSLARGYNLNVGLDSLLDALWRSYTEENPEGTVDAMFNSLETLEEPTTLFELDAVNYLQTIHGIDVGEMNTFGDENTDNERGYLKDKIATQQATELIKSKPTSPIEQFVRAIADATVTNVNINNTLDLLFKFWEANNSDLSQIVLTGELFDSISEVKRVLAVALSAILAARTDRLNLDDIFGGYNAFLNNINKGNSDWSKLAEINGDLADAMFTDLSSLFNKVRLFETLATANSTQKMLTQNKMGLVNKYLIYQALNLVFTPDMLHTYQSDELSSEVHQAWKRFSEALEKAELCKKYYNPTIDGRLSLSKDARFSVELEICNIGDALYKLALVDDRFSQSEWVAKNIVSKFSLLSAAVETTPLTLQTGNLDAYSALNTIWALTSYNILKFKQDLLNITKDLGYGVIPALEIVNYVTSAPKINQTRYSVLQAAEKEAFTTELETCDEDKLNKLVPADARSKTLEEKKQLASLMFETLSHTNLSVVEGSAGVGKSTGILAIQMRLLSRIDPKYTSKVLYVHTNEEKAKAGAENLGLKNYIAKGHKDLLDFFTDGYTLPTKKIALKSDSSPLKIEDGVHVKDPKLKDLKEVPSYIIVDEFSQLDQFTFDILMLQAKKHNIQVIMLGDLSQIHSSALATMYDVDIDLSINPNLGVHYAKLSLPMRTDNNLKNQNNTLVSDILHTKLKVSSLSLAWHQQDGMLFGDMVLPYDKAKADRVAEMTKVLRSLVEQTKRLRQLSEEEYKKKGKTGYDPLFSKVGVFAESSESDLGHIAILPEFRDEVSLIVGKDIAGLELAYYMIELPQVAEGTPAQMAAKFRLLYTGMSRARRGTVIVTYGTDRIPGYYDELISTEAQAHIMDTYSDRSIAMFNQNRVGQLTELTKDYKEEEPKKSVTTSAQQKSAPSAPEESAPAESEAPAPPPGQEAQASEAIQVPDDVNDELSGAEPIMSLGEDIRSEVAPDVDTAPDMSDDLILGEKDVKNILNRIMWYSFNSYSTGLQWENGIKLSIEKSLNEVGVTLRIDGIFGLNRFFLPNDDGRERYISGPDAQNNTNKLFGKLIQMVFHPNPENDADTCLTQIRDFFFDQLNPTNIQKDDYTVRFALITHPRKPIGKRYGIVDLYEGDRSEFNTTDLANTGTLNGTSVPRTQLYMVIEPKMRKAGDNSPRFSLPLALLISPITILKTLNSSGKITDPALSKAITGMNKGNLIKNLVAIYNLLGTPQNHSDFSNLRKLIYLWLDTNVNAHYFKDGWHPGKAFDNTGIRYTSHKGDNLVLNEEQMTYSREDLLNDQQNQKSWLPLRKFLNDPRIVTPHGVYALARPLQNKQLMPGTNTTVKHKLFYTGVGHPFVIIHSNPNLYLEGDVLGALLDENLQKTVKAFNILPPTATASELLLLKEYLVNKTEGFSGIQIGTALDIVNILEHILKDGSNFMKAVNTNDTSLSHFWNNLVVLNSMRAALNLIVSAHKEVIDAANSKDVARYKNAIKSLNELLYTKVKTLIDNHKLGELDEKLKEHLMQAFSTSHAEASTALAMKEGDYNLAFVFTSYLRHIPFPSRTTIRGTYGTTELSNALVEHILDLIDQDTQDLKIYYRIKRPPKQSALEKLSYFKLDVNDDFTIKGVTRNGAQLQLEDKDLYIYGKLDPCCWRLTEGVTDMLDAMVADRATALPQQGQFEAKKPITWSGNNYQARTGANTSTEETSWNKFAGIIGMNTEGQDDVSPERKTAVDRLRGQGIDVSYTDSLETIISKTNDAFLNGKSNIVAFNLENELRIVTITDLVRTYLGAINQINANEAQLITESGKYLFKFDKNSSCAYCILQEKSVSLQDENATQSKESTMTNEDIVNKLLYEQDPKEKENLLNTYFPQEKSRKIALVYISRWQVDLNDSWVKNLKALLEDQKSQSEQNKPDDKINELCNNTIFVPI